MSAKIYIIGQRFGRLKVIADAPPRLAPNGVSILRSLCVCDCQKQVVVQNSLLRKGLTKSCGCLRVEVSRATHYVHGHHTIGNQTPTYTTWQSMRQRCDDPNCHAFQHYGGRGIVVCDRWKRFENFLADMGERPSGLEIDRINNDGNYEPGNCRWATRKEQMRNTRQNKICTVRGVMGCVTELAEMFGVNPKASQQRLRRGWSPDEAFLLKVKAKVY
jgi:hypothetical protein